MDSDFAITSTDPSKDPLATLLTSTTEALSIRPSVLNRTASSRTLPTSTHPRVTIVVPAQRVPNDLLKGVRELAAGSARGNVSVVDGEVPKGGRSAHVWVVGFRKDESLERGLKVSCNYDDFTTIPEDADFEIEISYNRAIEAYRGLGHVLGVSRGLSTFKHPEAEKMDQRSDSEGEEEKETTADIPGEEDGIRWSGDVGAELRIDESCLFETVAVMIDCSRNGVMLVSAVKTLLRQLALMGNNVLQWPTYAGLKDTGDVMLAESPETYKFISKMILAITTPLRSKRIHIGMDEAHGVSEGRYRQLFGYKDSTKVFTDHLQRVKDICTEAGLAPMIWSDMLFCLQAKNNSLSSYYDASNIVSAQLAEQMPEVDTVFWNYYHCDPAPYTAKIAAHWQLTNRAPWMASGNFAITFQAKTNAYSFFERCLDLESAYTRNSEVDAVLLRKKFDGIVGGDFDDYVYASKLDDTQPETQPVDVKTHYTPNMAKWLLWEEPFYSFLSPQYRGYDLETHFSHLSDYLSQALSSDFTVMSTTSVPHSIADFPANKRLIIPCLLAKVLALKCHLRERLVKAYKEGDRAELVALAGEEKESRMSRLRSLVGQLHDAHRKSWASTYKPFGFEVLDLRYGGLRARLETMHRRLIAYLDVEDDSVTLIEELEVELQTIWPNQGPNLMLDYARASRPQYV
ncbi:hypothetical protein P7C70_g2649, partial [Phenoliferia sp. Uapishka_3]